MMPALVTGGGDGGLVQGRGGRGRASVFHRLLLRAGRFRGSAFRQRLTSCAKLLWMSANCRSAFAQAIRYSEHRFLPRVAGEGDHEVVEGAGARTNSDIEASAQIAADDDASGDSSLGTAAL
jgi:hypothetical protein